MWPESMLAECEKNNIPNVAYNGATDAEAPNTYLVSSKIDWEPYFEYIVNCVSEDKEIKKDDFMGIGDSGILAVGTSLNDVT